MGMQGAETSGRLGQGMAQMGMQGAQASGQLGLQGLGMQADIGKGIAALGSDVARLGLEQGKQLGTLGLQQASLGELVRIWDNVSKGSCSILVKPSKRRIKQFWKRTGRTKWRRFTSLINEWDFCLTSTKVRHRHKCQ